MANSSQSTVLLQTSCIIRSQRCVQKYCERVMRQRYQGYENTDSLETTSETIQFIHYKDCAKKYNIVFESISFGSLWRESATTIQRHMRGMMIDVAENELCSVETTKLDTDEIQTTCIS